jgi:hypothetical protein
MRRYSLNSYSYTVTTLGFVCYNAGAKVTAYELSASRRCDSTVLSAYYYQHVCGAQWGKNKLTFTDYMLILTTTRCNDVATAAFFGEHLRSWAVCDCQMCCSVCAAVLTVATAATSCQIPHTLPFSAPYCMLVDVLR